MFKSVIVWLILLLATAAAWSDEASAGQLDDDDVRAVRAVVEGQLSAFAADDDDRAFGFAVPQVRAQFGDAGHFAAMVRDSYPMLIRPVSVSFFRPELVDGDVLQIVQFRSKDGQVWRAVYKLERQPDASWRIAGCVVAADDESKLT